MGMKQRIFINKEVLTEKILSLKTKEEISRDLGISRSTLYKWIKKYESKEVINDVQVEKICECCGNKYLAHHLKAKTQKYCSPKCREKQWQKKNPERLKV